MAKHKIQLQKKYCPFVWLCKVYISVTLWSVAMSISKIMPGLVIQTQMKNALLIRNALICDINNLCYVYLFIY